jgi:hypothetical protein
MRTQFCPIMPSVFMSVVFTGLARTIGRLTRVENGLRVSTCAAKARAAELFEPNRLPGLRVRLEARWLTHRFAGQSAFEAGSITNDVCVGSFRICRRRRSDPIKSSEDDLCSELQMPPVIRGGRQDSNLFQVVLPLYYKALSRSFLYGRIAAIRPVTTPYSAGRDTNVTPTTPSAD